jgi:hypothetical protein
VVCDSAFGLGEVAVRTAGVVLCVGLVMVRGVRERGLAVRCVVWCAVFSSRVRGRLQCLNCELSDFVGLPNLTHGSKLRLVLVICLSKVVSLVSIYCCLYTRSSVLAGGGIGGGFSSASSGVVKPLSPSRF